MWRHLDQAGRTCRLRMRRRRLACPTHGVLAESVPFARPGAGFTRDFEDLVVWLTTRSDKTTVATFARVAWRTVGAMCERVAADVLDPDRLAGLVDVGVDEISWRKHHRYLTLVTDHVTSTVVWGAPGRDAATLGTFFDELPAGGVERIEAVSMDLSPAHAKAVRDRAPDAVICFDPFHVVQAATNALDSVRRQVWQSARRYRDKSVARKYKGARWALLKNPADLTDTRLRPSKRYAATQARYGGPTSSRKRCARCSPATTTPTTSWTCSTGGVHEPNAPGSPTSSRLPPRSASTRTASPPPSNAVYRTAATKA